MATVLWATFLLMVGVALFNVWRSRGMQGDQTDILRHLYEAGRAAQAPREAQAQQEVLQFMRGTNPDVQRWVDAYLNTPAGQNEVMQAVYRMMNMPVNPVPAPDRLRNLAADQALRDAITAPPVQAQDQRLTAGTIREAVRHLRQADYYAHQQAAYATPRMAEQEYARMQQAQIRVYAAQYFGMPYNPNHTVPVETEEQRVARELREQQERERQEEANRRARGLLQEKLTPEQWTDWETTRSFVVISQSGKQYRLGDARSFNVTLLGSPIRQTFCAIPTGSYAFPIEDQLVAQKLWLETDEQQFLDTANWIPQRPHTYPTAEHPNAGDGPDLWNTPAHLARDLGRQAPQPLRNGNHPDINQDQPNRQMRRAMAPVCLELGCTFRIAEDARRFSYRAIHRSADGTTCEAEVRNTYDEQHTAALRPIFTNLARTAHGRIA